MIFTDVLKSVELNLTDLCNLQCSFCPHAFGFPNSNVHMSLDTVELIAKHLDEIEFGGDVVLSGKGEPTLHQYFEEAVNILSKFNLLLITNGKNLKQYEHLIPKFSSVHYDIYDLDPTLITNEWEGRYNNLHLDHRPDYGIEVKTETPYGLNMSSRGYEEHITKTLDDTTCSIIFERIIIDWNGDYNLCCHDWFNRISLGNIKTETISEYIEENPMLMSYRTNLVEGNRKDLTVCKNCDKLCPIETNTYKGLMDMYNACR